MKRIIGLALCLVALARAAPVGAQPLPTARPEDVGMSSQRLERIGTAFHKDIDQGKLPGVVIMIARKGKLVYSEAFGFQDKAAGTPMPKDAIFRVLDDQAVRRGGRRDADGRGPSATGRSNLEIPARVQERASQRAKPRCARPGSV